MTPTLSGIIKKTFCYFLLFSVFFCLQTIFGKDIAVFNISPYFMPCIIVTIAMLDGQTTALCFALCAGIATDAFVAQSTSYYTIAYLLLVALLTVLLKDVFRRSFFSATALSFLATWVVSFSYSVLFYVIFRQAPLSVGITVALPEAFYSTLFIIFIYPLVNLIAKATN